MFLVCFLKIMHPVVNKDVLVIVPTHSRDHTFSYTVESILNQSYKNFNLAIIGDGVDDEYKKNIQKIADSDDRIFFYDNVKTKLTGRTGEVHRNQPIQDFNPKYITYCGDDDLLISNHIEKMVEEIQGYDFVHPVAYMLKQKGNNSEYINRFLQNKVDSIYIKAYNFISLTGVMHTKELFDKTDGWTAAPNRLGTDHHMWLKFMDIEGFKGKSSLFSTTIKINRSGIKMQQKVTLKDELEFIKEWSEAIKVEGFIEKWNSYIDQVIANKKGNPVVYNIKE